jgi:hypothetical protein
MLRSFLSYRKNPSLPRRTGGLDSDHSITGMTKAFAFSRKNLMCNCNSSINVFFSVGFSSSFSGPDKVSVKVINFF